MKSSLVIKEADFGLIFDSFKIVTKFKKRIKLFLKILFIFPGLPLIILFIIQSGKVQSLIVNNLSENLLKDINSRISVGSTNITYLGKSHLWDVCIIDLYGDTLFYSKEITFRLKKFQSRQDKIAFRKITLRDCDINITFDSLQKTNIKYFVRELKSLSDSDSTTSKKVIVADNFDIINSRLTLYYKFDKKTVPYNSINYEDMEIVPINIEASNFKIENGVFTTEIEKMSAREKTGFTILDYEGLLTISNQTLAFTDTRLYSTRSQLQVKKTIMNFDSFKDFREGGVYNKIDFTIELDNSNVGFKDLAYFVPALDNMEGFGTLSGNFSGKLNKFRGKDIEFTYGEKSKFEGNISIDGLPDFQNSFVYAKINTLKSNTKDIEKFSNALYNKKINTSLLKKFGEISYKGDFTGFPYDFVSYGKLQTETGTFYTDILIRPNENGKTRFNGKINSLGVDLGLLSSIKTGLLGKASLNSTIQGEMSSNGQFQGTVNAKLDELFFNEYNYSNILLTGSFDNRQFEGNIDISDPNLEMEFDGLLNFNTDTTEVNFVANVIRSNLYQLNFDKSDPSSFATFYLTAKGFGTNLDNLNGEIKLLNSFFFKNEKQVQFYDFSMIAINSPGLDQIKIRSDFIDADIKGRYKLSSLRNSLYNLANKTLPGFYVKQDYIPNDENNFSFDIKLKNINDLVSFFHPDLNISDESIATGFYKPDFGEFNLYITAPELELKSFYWKDLVINSHAVDSNMYFSLGSQMARIFNSFNLENLTLLAETENESVKISSRWMNWDTLVSKGGFNAVATLNSKQNSVIPVIDIDIAENNIVIDDSLWILSNSNITIDSSTVKIENLKLQHSNQSVSVDGVISDNPSDKLFVNFNNYNLEGLNIITRKDHLTFSGNLTARGFLGDIYNNPFLKADIVIDTLIINNSVIGATYLSANWSSKHQIEINGKSLIANKKNLEVSGIYNPQSKIMDIDFDVKHLSLSLFTPFVEDVFSETSGICELDLNLSGSLKKPLLNGKIHVDKGGTKINYLNTYYFFSEEFEILNNSFIFDNFRFKDIYGNKAILQGSITNNYFKSYNLNLNIQSENILVLNTTLKDNTNFYGKGFATGLAQIMGPTDNIEFIISAKTNKGTELNVPLSYSESGIGNYEFIYFKSGEDILDHADDDSPRRFRPQSGITVDLELEVNDNAEVNIIFDSKVGDVIEARGNGNIKVNVDKRGDLMMYGDYTISGGDYLFTLQNLFNKKFEIEQGGVITWNGDAKEANINLKAIYNLRAPLENLLFHEENDEFSKRIPIQCQLMLTNQLLNPDIQFGIHLPTSDPETRAKVQSELTTEEELTKQFLSLILVNNFFSDPSKIATGTSDQRTATGTNLGKVTTFEMLSNQFSHYLSQWSNDLDVGVYYRPEDEIAAQEFEVELSTRLLNDRVSINTNVEIQGNSVAREQADYISENQTNNIVGEFEVNWQVSDNGKVHLKAFNRSNDFYTYRTSDYTQGVALSFKEEFDSLKDLWKKVFSQNNKSNN